MASLARRHCQIFRSAPAESHRRLPSRSALSRSAAGLRRQKQCRTTPSWALALVGLSLTSTWSFDHLAFLDVDGVNNAAGQMLNGSLRLEATSTVPPEDTPASSGAKAAHSRKPPKPTPSTSMPQRAGACVHIHHVRLRVAQWDSGRALEPFHRRSVIHMSVTGGVLRRVAGIASAALVAATGFTRRSARLPGLGLGGLLRRLRLRIACCCCCIRCASTWSRGP